MLCISLTSPTNLWVYPNLHHSVYLSLIVISPYSTYCQLISYPTLPLISLSVPILSSGPVSQSALSLFLYAVPILSQPS